MRPGRSIQTTCARSAYSFAAARSGRRIDVWEQYLFHYVSEGGFTFLVMADDSVGRWVVTRPIPIQSKGSDIPYVRRRMPFAFLADLQQKVCKHRQNISRPNRLTSMRSVHVEIRS